MNLGEQFRSEIVTASPAASIASVVKSMAEERVGAVVVLEDRKVVGIVTDRDVALNLGQRRVEPDSPVEEIMSKKVLTIWEDQGVFNATQYLMGHKVRRLPIVNRQEELVGMLTLDDLIGLLGQELVNLSRAVAPSLAQKVI